jgi:ribonuclease P protein component
MANKMVKSSPKHKKMIIQYGDAAVRPGGMLRLKSEFNFVKKNGTKCIGNNFMLVYAKATDWKLRIGIICGHKFSKKAVTRNRARRLIKESFRLIKARVAVSHIIFIPRKKIMNKHLQDVQPEMIELLNEAGIWMKP